MMSVLFLASALFAGDPYVLVFAWQDTPTGYAPHPRNTHSFATWVDVNGQKIEDSFTISWAAPHGVRLFHGPEPGRNLTLDESLELAQAHSLHVTCWGPYRVTQEGWKKAREHYLQLEEAEKSHSILYKALDRSTRHYNDRPAINCIHALTDLAIPNLVTGHSCGVSASLLVVSTFQSNGIIESEEPEASWLVQTLCGNHQIQHSPSAQQENNEPTVHVQMAHED